MATAVSERSTMLRTAGIVAAVFGAVAVGLIMWQGIDTFVGGTATGLALGAIYALLALGFVIIFKATQVVNFALGAIAALGAYFVVYFAVVLNVPGRWFTTFPDWVNWGLSAVLAVVATAIVGLIIERLTIRPMIGEPLFSVAMVTIGLDIVIRTLTNDLISTDPRPLNDPWGVNVLEVGPLTIAHTEIVTIVTAVVLVAAVAVFFRSRLGVAMRATAFDQEAAMAQGISVGRIFAIAWAIGAGLAAIGGISAPCFRIIGTTQLDDFALLVLDDLITTNHVGIAQTHFAAGDQALVDGVVVHGRTVVVIVASRWLDSRCPGARGAAEDCPRVSAGSSLHEARLRVQIRISLSCPRSRPR